LYQLQGINFHNKKTEKQIPLFGLFNYLLFVIFPEPPTLVFGGDVFLGGVLIDDFGFTSDPLEPPGVFVIFPLLPVEGGGVLLPFFVILPVSPTEDFESTLSPRLMIDPFPSFVIGGGVFFYSFVGGLSGITGL